jgi:hypothetical protein
VFTIPMTTSSTSYFLLSQTGGRVSFYFLQVIFYFDGRELVQISDLFPISSVSISGTLTVFYISIQCVIHTLHHTYCRHTLLTPCHHDDTVRVSYSSRPDGRQRHVVVVVNYPDDYCMCEESMSTVCL